MDVNASGIVRIPLKANAPTKKKYNVGRFHTKGTLDFATFEKPVRMYRAPPEATEAPPPPPPPQPNENNNRTPFRKKFIPLPQKPKEKDQLPWHIEDAAGNNAYDGTKEGGQTSNYVLLVYENNAFHVIPCNEWYNFKPKRTYQTLTLEEAEAKMHIIKQKGERAALKMEKNPQAIATAKEKIENGSSSSAGQRDKEDEEFQTHEEEDEDKFAAFGKGGSDDESKTKNKKTKSKKGGDEEGEGDNEEEEEGDKEEEPDWKGMFDDDEEEQIADDGDEEAPKGMREKDDDAEGDDSALTDAGKELRNILKSHRDEDMSEASEGPSDSEEDDDDEDIDEEKMEEIVNRFPTRGLNITAQPAVVKTEDKKDQPETTTRVSTPPQPGSPPTQDKKKKGKKESKSSSKKTKTESKTDATPKADSKSKKAGGSPPTTVPTDSPTMAAPTNGKGSKRPSSPVASPPTGSASKKARTSSDPIVSEAEVIKLLKKHPKGMPTIDFIKYFQPAFVSDPDQKTKLTQLTTKICAITNKLLVLKPEYK